MTERFGRLSILRGLVYGAYTLFGLLNALSMSYSLGTTEAFFAYQRMYDVWMSPSFEGLIEIPKRAAELGSILLYLVSTPFLLVLKPCLTALHLAALLWSLAGLFALERTIRDRAESLLAVALVGLGLSHDTLFHIMSAGGGQLQILLPFGLTLLLASRFLKDPSRISRRQAFLYGLCAVFIVVFMIAMATYMFLACVVCLVALPKKDAWRLLPFLALGVAVGGALGIPLFLHQHEPTPNLGFTFGVFGDYAARLAWLFLDDMPAYLAIRGWMVSGYVLEIALIGLIVWVFASGAFRQDPLLRILALWSLVIPFLLPAHPWHMPDLPTIDVGRLRFFAMAWPVWGSLLGIGAVRLWRSDPASKLWRVLGRVPAAVAAIWLLSGTFLSFAIINYCHLGITLRMPLDTPIGRILAHHGFPGMVNIRQLPGDLRGTYALYRSFSVVYERDPPLLAALEEMSPEFREPFVSGLSFILCEGTVPVTLETRAALPALLERLSPEERAAMDNACELARRWRNGDVAFRAVAWPINPQTIECSTCRLLEGWEIWGTPKIETKHRPRWPWSRD